MTRFQRRLELALQMNEMKAVDLCKATGLSSGTISQYRSGVCKPKMERLMLIAEALNVSVSWLLGYDTPLQPDQETGHAVFDSLSSENKLRAIDYMKYLKSKEKPDEEE